MSIFNMFRAKRAANSGRCNGDDGSQMKAC
uniref:Uncharacterized protein n=1 Tax=Arundo donax TaxID=35708 RepID=A0A0A8ZV02_ARUDO